MAKTWALLHRKSTRSRDLARLFDENPRAEAFFYRMLAGSDSFGRLEADPQLLRADLCPFTSLDIAIIASLVEALEGAGLLYRYTVDGHEYVQLATYDHHQGEQAWTRLRADCPPPPDWVPPASLVAFLELADRKARAEGKHNRYPPERYGLESDGAGGYRAVTNGYTPLHAVTAGDSSLHAVTAGDAPLPPVTAGYERDAHTHTHIKRLNARARAREAPVEPEEPEPPSDPPSPGDDHLLTSNYPELVAALTAARAPTRGNQSLNWSHRRIQRFVAEVVRCMRDEPGLFSEAELERLLRAEPPARSDTVHSWWRRMAGQKRAAGNGGNGPREPTRAEREDAAPELGAMPVALRGWEHGWRDWWDRGGAPGEAEWQRRREVLRAAWRPVRAAVRAGQVPAVDSLPKIPQDVRS